MKTKYWNISKMTKREQQVSIIEASQLLQQGEIVAFPTETVYGLGANATNEQAVQKIFHAKGRPQDNPLIVHVADALQMESLVRYWPAYVDKLLAAYTPGPITFVLPSNDVCSAAVTAGLDTVGVRIPSHPVAHQLLSACQLPIAAPSANISGRPSPTSAQHVWHDLSDKIAGILDGGATGVGLESTVIDCTQDIPVILRPGGITKEQIEKVAGAVMVDPGLAVKNENEQPKSPGMKYRHYSPEVPLWIVPGASEHLQSMIYRLQMEGKRVGVMGKDGTVEKLQVEEIIKLGNTMEQVAANLYDALRTFKLGEVDIILCESFPEQGIGQAVMNRLTKAASRIIAL
ncbi:L-threonylcarbamoyladenylate synthase [Virgibacillus chiguensis]|uniref:Threonylcarbamoyl-AMP synthase n=1 Tax=Virgibacillus chiguensis TaxID=411959 RepID=A0A1M5U919_9BACI|nr:L-threonylcarbamoyladenylate synthase [Virgibacillus chiguensis]SHH59356.1 L-threonylcarbamoyladenylate synthase [Virgibacillus chiguensis]